MIAFSLMGEDKDKAVSTPFEENPERISERTLHETALIGGFPGIILGAKVFHHKVSKLSFWPPVAVSVILWVILLSILIMYRLLQIVI